MVVEKAGSNGGMAVAFYICIIGLQIDIFKLKRLFYNFCPTSVTCLLDYMEQTLLRLVDYYLGIII